MQVTSSSDYIWAFAVAFEFALFSGTILFGALSFRSQRNLFRILSQTKPQTYARVTTLWGVQGGRNSWQGIQYIQSKEDDEDADIAAAKKRCRNQLRIFLLLLLALFLFPILCGIVWISVLGLREKI